MALLAGSAAVCAVAAPRAADTKPAATASASALSDAVCPIVYPLDQSPSERGYHYIFYGNAFFINDDGYLLTAAHVLNQLNGVQPFILLRRAMAPPRLVPVTVIANDPGHDVALLRATPNPFAGKFQVRSLPLLVKSPAATDGVTASALRPSRLKDPHSFDAFVEDRPGGQVLGYEFTSDHGHQDTELFLFSHEVLYGDSGAPVVSDQAQAVVGLVEGRWLRPAGSLPAGAMKQATGIGAAVPVHYAIALLQRNGIAWHPLEMIHSEDTNAWPAAQDSPPLPLSLVAPPYPSQALLSGEVVLDALVDEHGQLADIRVVLGDPPFVDKALSSVRTWSFLPARANGEAQEARIGIAVQFHATVGAMRAQPAGTSAESGQNASRDALERGPAPSAIVQPVSKLASGSEGSVIVSAQIDAQGRPAALRFVHGEASLASPLTTALSQWRFLPAKHAGKDCPSTFIAVEVLRASASTAARPSKAAQSLLQ